MGVSLTMPEPFLYFTSVFCNAPQKREFPNENALRQSRPSSPLHSKTSGTTAFTFTFFPNGQLTSPLPDKVLGLEGCRPLSIDQISK